MKSGLHLMVVAAVLSVGGAVTAGPDLIALRAQVDAARTAVGRETVDSVEAAQLLFDAGEVFAEAVAILDEGNPARVQKAFGRINRALKLVRKAAKEENTQAAAAFSDEIGMALWLKAASLFAGDSPSVVDPDAGPLGRKLNKRLRRPAELAMAGKYGGAIKKLKAAWKIQLKIDDDP